MFDGMDMTQLMQQAQQMMQAQQELASKTYTGSAGGGMVSVVLTGEGELTDVTIAPEACDPEDTETLAALIIAAVRDARSQAEAGAKALLPGI